MNNQTTTKPIAWSYSAITAHNTCPKQYHEVKVLKRYSDDNIHNKWGNEVHEYFADRLLGKDRIDPRMTMYDGVIERLRAIEGTLQTEQKFAITNTFKPTEWFAKDVWCRGIADALWIKDGVAKTLDLKTGKRKIKNSCTCLSRRSR